MKVARAGLHTESAVTVRFRTVGGRFSLNIVLKS